MIFNDLMERRSNMHSATKTQRIEYIDVVKGLAMLCVIIGHMGWDYADRIIYPFHMPLFLICSGYFISEKKDFYYFRKEKVKRLILPYAVTCVGVCILSALANLVQGMPDRVFPDLGRWGYASFYGSCIDYARPFLIKGIGQIWFLLALFWALLIVKYFGKMREGLVMILLLAYMSYVSSQYIWLPWSLQAGGVCALFVYTGYILRSRQVLNKGMNIWLFLFGTGVWVFEAIFDIRVNLRDNTIDAGVFSLIGAVFICYVVFWISRLVSKIKLLKVPLNFCGQNSLLILCFHELETYFFPWSIVYGILAPVGVLGYCADLVVLLLKITFCIVCTWTAGKVANKPLQYLGFAYREK